MPPALNPVVTFMCEVILLHGSPTSVLRRVRIPAIYLMRMEITNVLTSAAYQSVMR